VIPQVPGDLSQLSHAQKDVLIVALVAEIEAQKAANAALSVRMAELEARLKQLPKTPDNSSTPPSRGQKGNRPAKGKREGPRVGSLGRQGGGRKLAGAPDQFVTAKPTHCRQCGAALAAGDHVLHGRYDKIDLPAVHPVVTRVERYAGRCPCCGGVTVAPVPEGLEDGTPPELVEGRPRHCRRGALSALRPRSQLSTPGPPVSRSVRRHRERGGAGQYVSAGQAALRSRSGGDPRPAAALASDLL
jgi:hypothetical protein